jgi:hypothetical protein
MPPDRPLRSYRLLTAVFGTAFAGGLALTRERLPQQTAAGDVALLSVATFKLSRLIARERVTAGIRVPFTDAEGARPQGRGMRRALGELLTCPYCLEQWIAGGFVVGLAAAPRATRATATLFTVVAASDLLQHGWRRLQPPA